MSKKYNFKKLVIDKQLKKPHINDEGEAIVFVDEMAYKKFRNDDAKGIYSYQDSSNLSIKDISSNCYAAGAIFLKLIGNNKIGDNTVERIRLNLSELNRQYYNNKLNRYLIEQVRKKDKESLLKVTECKFILAVNLNSERNNYILYATAKIKGKDAQQIILGFTDIDNFNKWQEVVEEKYKPLEVDFTGLHRIGGYHGFLIDPLSFKLFLPPKLLDKMYKLKNESEKK